MIALRLLYNRWAGGVVWSRVSWLEAEMGKLRVLSARGDRTVEWDLKQAETGDVEAEAAVREAERIFQEALGRGATAFKVAPGVPATKVTKFDPEADQIVVVPKVAGG